jgi:hypothetical protein
MNTPVIGRVYHVVDKTTGEVVKVGSTTQDLRKRFQKDDYRRKYINHYIKEFRRIESSEFDVYEPNNAFCPFLWHLVAAEHLEIIRIDTYRKTKFSNQRWPLDQKFCGFDGTEHCFIGGINAGKVAVETGQIQALGKSNVQTGHIQRIQKTGAALGGRAAGPANGKKCVESGLLRSVCSAGGQKGGRILFETKKGLFGLTDEQKRVNQIKGGSAACRMRTSEQQRHSGQMSVRSRHLKRGIPISENCTICKRGI